MAKEALVHDLTPRQVELLICICKSLTAKPTSLMNMEKFAELGGFANLNSAQANYHGIWKKVMEGSAGATGEGGEGEKGEKATPKKRGRKVTKENDDDEETPAKKTKAIPKRGKKVPKANEDGDGEEDVKVKNEDGAGEEDEET